MYNSSCKDYEEEFVEEGKKGRGYCFKMGDKEVAATGEVVATIRAFWQADFQYSLESNSELQVHVLLTLCCKLRN